MSRQLTLEDWIDKIISREKKDPEPISTSTSTETRFDPGSIADLRKLFSQAPEPETTISGIFITSFIFPGWQVEKSAEGKSYILINRDTWESWAPAFEKGSSHPLAALSSIPVFDDEDRARKIIIESITEKARRAKEGE